MKTQNYEKVNKSTETQINNLKKEIEALDIQVKYSKYVNGKIVDKRIERFNSNLSKELREYSKEIISKDEMNKAIKIKDRIRVIENDGRKNNKAFMNDTADEFGISLNQAESLLLNSLKLSNLYFGNMGINDDEAYHIDSIDGFYDSVSFSPQLDYFYELMNTMDSLLNIYR